LRVERLEPRILLDVGLPAPPVGALSDPPDVDLVVEDAAEPTVSAGIGAEVTLPVAVANTGAEAAVPNAGDHFDTALFLSTDATVTDADSLLGDVQIASVAAGGRVEESLTFTAPTAPGTYTLAWCADYPPAFDLVTETNEANNWGGTVTLTVVAPDLVVDAPSPDAYTAAPWETVTVPVTVRNAGDGDATPAGAEFDVALYLSTDTTVTDTDERVGAIGVAALAAGGSLTDSVSFAPPADPGTYTLAWFADDPAAFDEVTESNEANNWGAPITLTVAAPDLVVDPAAGTAYESGAAANVTVPVTVRNAGTATADPSPEATFQVGLYLSDDAEITVADTRVGAVLVAPLASGATHTGDLTFAAPASLGTYYLAWCADDPVGFDVVPEIDETNNWSETLTLSVVKPDLAIDAPVQDAYSAGLGENVTIPVTVRNVTAALADPSPAAAFTVGLYLSSDATVTGADARVGGIDLAALAGNSAHVDSLTFAAPAAAGDYTLAWCADDPTAFDLVDEGDETNNWGAPITLTVRDPNSVDIGGATGYNQIVYTDGDGTTVRLRLAGDGAANVAFGGDNFAAIGDRRRVTVTGADLAIGRVTLFDTTERTTLAVNARGGNDGIATIATVAGTTPLRALRARNVDLVGEGLLLTGAQGYARMAQIEDLRNGADLVMEGAGADRGVVLRLGALGSGSDATLASPLRMLRAESWSAGMLTAPWARTVRLTGACGADVLLTGADPRGYAATRVVVLGDMSGALSAAGAVRGVVGRGDWLGDLVVSGADARGIALGNLRVNGLMAGAANLAGGINRGAAAEWTGDLTANWAGALQTRGAPPRAPVPYDGDWVGAISLDGVDAPRGLALRMLRVRGTAAGAWNIDRDAGRFMLGESSGAWHAVVDGDVAALVVRGDRRAGLAGDLSGAFEADSLRRLAVRQDMVNATVALGEDADGMSLRSVSVRRWIDGSQLETTGDIGAITACGLRDASLFAGVTSMADADGDSVYDLPDPATDLALASATRAEIGRVRVRGVLDAPYSLINANIAAAQIGLIDARDVCAANSGVPLGVAADAIDRLVSRGTDAEGRYVDIWTDLTLPAHGFTDDDYAVRLT
jgi:hypothetical protein